MSDRTIRLTYAQARIVNEALALLEAEVDGNEQDYDRPAAKLALIARTRLRVFKALQ
jgi:hypothetical protein